MLGGAPRHILTLALTGWWLGRRHGARFSILPARPNYELPALLKLVASGAVKPVIDSVLPLSGAHEAFWKIGRGKARGKLLISP